MGGVAALMLVVGGSDALSGIQNITIIMAAPFVVVMVVMCIALMKDLRNDPLVRRGQKVVVVMEQAVEYGTERHGEEFFLNVKPKECDPVTVGPQESVPADPSNGAAPSNGRPVEQPAPAVFSANGKTVETEDVPGRSG